VRCAYQIVQSSCFFFFPSSGYHSPSLDHVVRHLTMQLLCLSLLIVLVPVLGFGYRLLFFLGEGEARLTRPDLCGWRLRRKLERAGSGGA
jgi:hypothetical protein